MKTHATDAQKRAIKFLSRKHPDTVLPLLAERGGVVDALSFKQAHEIMDIVGQKHPYKKREERQKDDQWEERKRKQQEQRDRERREREELEDRQEQEREDDRDLLEDQQQDDERLDEQEQEEQKMQDNRQDQKMKKQGFRKGSMQEYIANKLREHNLDVPATRAAIADDIGKIPQLTFRRNVDGARVPYPLGNINDDSQAQTQHGRAIKTLFSVKRILLQGGEGRDEKKRDQREHDKLEDKQQNEEQKKDERDNRTAIELLAFIRSTRKYCEDKAADGKPLDEIGLRPVEYGAAMLSNSIPLVAIKHAMTMHFPPEARRALGVRDYDVLTFPGKKIEGVHGALPYSMAVINSRDGDGYRIPLTFTGPKGTGKTRLARDISRLMDLPFGMASMTSATSPSTFNGRPMVADDGSQALIAALSAMAQYADSDEKAAEYAKQAYDLARVRHSKGDTVVSEFVRIYGGGGVFLFDELDAADENLLLGVNAAIANNVFFNPATGKKIDQHPDFIPVAAMNTLGLGSGRDYNARNRLDAATLDRWNMGRVQIKLDPRIEESMFWNIINRKA